MVKNPPADAGGTGSIPGLERFHRLRSNYTHGPQLPGRVPQSLLFCSREAPTEKPVCCSRVPPAHHGNQRKPEHSSEDRAAENKEGKLSPETAVDAHLVVTAVSQQGHQDAEAPEVDDLLAELVADSQAGQGAAELAQDAGIVGEHCRGGRGNLG